MVELKLFVEADDEPGNRVVLLSARRAVARNGKSRPTPLKIASSLLTLFQRLYSDDNIHCMIVMLITIAMILQYHDPLIRDGVVCCAQKVASTHMNATACDKNMHMNSHVESCGVNHTTYSAHRYQYWLIP